MSQFKSNVDVREINIGAEDFMNVLILFIHPVSYYYESGTLVKQKSSPVAGF